MFFTSGFIRVVLQDVSLLGSEVGLTRFECPLQLFVVVIPITSCTASQSVVEAQVQAFVGVQVLQRAAASRRTVGRRVFLRALSPAAGANALVVVHPTGSTTSDAVVKPQPETADARVQIHQIVSHSTILHARAKRGSTG